MERSCAKQGEIYLFPLPGTHSCAHLAWVFADDESNPQKFAPILSFIERDATSFGFLQTQVPW